MLKLPAVSAPVCLLNLAIFLVLFFAHFEPLLLFFRLVVGLAIINHSPPFFTETLRHFTVELAEKFEVVHFLCAYPMLVRHRLPENVRMGDTLVVMFGY